MNAVFTPQVPHFAVEANYSATGDVLTVEINGISEVFDFTGMPDGRASEVTAETLPINPVLGAVKENGTLTVTLAKYIGPKPEMEEYINIDENGEEVVTFEDDAAFQARLQAWKDDQVNHTATL